MCVVKYVIGKLIVGLPFIILVIKLKCEEEYDGCIEDW